jgi:hypothetical protein
VVFWTTVNPVMTPLLPVLGQVAQALPYRVLGVVNLDPPSFERDFPCGSLPDPDEGLGNLGSPRPDQAGKAEDFALAHLEADVVEQARHRKVLHLECDPLLRPVPRREDLVERAADHPLRHRRGFQHRVIVDEQPVA